MSRSKIEAIIDEGTSPNITSSNYSFAKNLIEEMKKVSNGEIIALTIFVEKLRTFDAKTGILAINMMECCAKSGGASFHEEIGRNRFLNELARLMSPKYDAEKVPEDVKKRISIMLYDWYKYYPQYSKIANAFKTLRGKGYIKDEYLKKESSGVIEKNVIGDNDTRTKLNKLLKSSKAEDLNLANSLIKNMVHKEESRANNIYNRKEKINSIKDKIKLLRDIMENNKESFSNLDMCIFREIKKMCIEYHDDLNATANGAINDKDPYLDDLLKLSEELTNTLNDCAEFEKLFDDNRTSVSSKSNNLIELDDLFNNTGSASNEVTAAAAVSTNDDNFLEFFSEIPNDVPTNSQETRLHDNSFNGLSFQNQNYDHSLLQNQSNLTDSANFMTSQQQFSVQSLGFQNSENQQFAYPQYPNQQFASQQFSSQQQLMNHLSSSQQQPMNHLTSSQQYGNQQQPMNYLSSSQQQPMNHLSSSQQYGSHQPPSNPVSSLNFQASNNYAVTNTPSVNAYMGNASSGVVSLENAPRENLYQEISPPLGASYSRESLVNQQTNVTFQNSMGANYHRDHSVHNTSTQAQNYIAGTGVLGQLNTETVNSIGALKSTGNQSDVSISTNNLQNFDINHNFLEIVKTSPLIGSQLTVCLAQSKDTRNPTNDLIKLYLLSGMNMTMCQIDNISVQVRADGFENLFKCFPISTNKLSPFNPIMPPSVFTMILAVEKSLERFSINLSYSKNGVSVQESLLIDTNSL